MILNADARFIPLRDGAVHTVVTSPPYWGLRDYGTATWEGGDTACDHRHQLGGEGAASSKQNTSAGTQTIQYRDACRKCGARRIDRQLGLEATPDEYVAGMVDVFREVWRVLRDDGTCWLNLGDSYHTGDGYTAAPTTARHAKSMQRGNPHSDFQAPPNRRRQHDLKPKDLVGIPWRVAFALQADGWYLRSDVIWSKRNPMPESITDRPTKSHEYLFLLAKRERYYYDAEAIKEPQEEQERTRRLREQAAGLATRYGLNRDQLVGQAPAGRNGVARSVEARHRLALLGTRNRRSVWEIATQPYPEAHFATFPEALVEPCILAGTSERGACAACGAPWARVIEAEGPDGRRAIMRGGKAYDESGAPLMGDNMIDHGVRGSFTSSGGATLTRTTVGWAPGCSCDAATQQPLVLDPFAGSGTVGLVCQRLGRRFIGLELKPDYCQMAFKRTAQLGLV